MPKGDDAWLESLDEFKMLKSYEKQKERAHHELVKSERTVRGDWKPRQKGRGDWICPRHECGNINFGYRDECNLCSEPRPKSTFFNIKGMHLHLFCQAAVIIYDSKTHDFPIKFQ